MLYTGRGDKGDTSFFGAPGRVSKTDAAIELLGTLDELNSVLGVCRTKVPQEISVFLETLQQDLFIIQAEIAGAPKKLEEEVLDSVVALDDLLEILYEIFSKNFGISQDLIKSESAKQEVVVCRRIICYLLYSKYKSNGVTYDKITSYVGEKTRSLVLKLVTQHSKKSAPHLNEYLVDYTFVLKVIKYRLTGKI